MLDPNWFYSSLAQCAAAIVGLIGAVLATRLQQQLVELRAHSDALRARLVSLRDDLRGRANSVIEFGHFADERIAAMRSVLTSGGLEMSITADKDLWGGGKSGTAPWQVSVTPDSVARYERERELVEPVSEALRTRLELAANLQDVRRALDRVANIMPPHLLATLDGYQSQVGILSEQANSHRRLVVASIQVPIVLAVIMTWLCVFGLISPLWFLSAYSSTSKIVLLGGFTLGILALPGYVVREIVAVYRLGRISV